MLLCRLRSLPRTRLRVPVDPETDRIAAALTAGTAMLALAVVVVLVLIVRPGKASTPTQAAPATSAP